MNIINAIQTITEDRNCSIHISSKHVSIHVAPQGVNKERLTKSVVIERKNPAELRMDLFKMIKEYEEVNDIEL